MSAQSSGQRGTTQSAINALVANRLERLEENYDKIIMILRGDPGEANGKDSVIGRLRTLEIEQNSIAKELTRHLEFHQRIAEKVDEEQKERREFQQKIFFTLLAFLLSNVGAILIVLRYALDVFSIK